MTQKAFYSWILPIYNEAQSLPQLLTEISKAMGDRKYEIVALDDGSSDKSAFVLNELVNKYPLNVYSFKKRVGKWQALRTGFGLAKGGVIITSDSDLQDDPAEVISLLNQFGKNELDLISGWRKKRQDNFYKIFLSNLGNKLVSVLTGHKFLDLNSPFKIYKKGVLDKLPKEGALLRFSLFFGYKMGFKVTEFKVRHRKRKYGKSKFGVVKYLRILYDLVLVLLLFSGSGRLTNNK